MEEGQESSQGVQETQVQQQQPEALVQSLRCPVCLDYFTAPHTLPCGHTFCLSCLRILARVTRHSRTRTPLERLRMRCPSCRKLTPARPILRRKASVNYALKEVVSQWFSSPLSTGTVRCLTLRSQPSQTDNPELTQEGGVTFSAIDDDTDIAKDETREILLHICESLSGNNAEEKQIQEIFAAVDDIATTEDSHITSSSEEESEPEAGPLLGDLNVINDDDEPPEVPLLVRFVHGFRGYIRIVRSEGALVVRGVRESRSRLILTIFWFVYGGIVVCMANGFLPWMMLYTLLYFIILYAELSPQAILG